MWAGLTREELLTWALDRWRAEVAYRPRHNIHRPTLDQTWRQVIRYAGGNPEDLLGPVQTTIDKNDERIPHCPKCGKSNIILAPLSENLVNLFNMNNNIPVTCTECKWTGTWGGVNYIR